jgi:hypothetical protein
VLIPLLLALGLPSAEAFSQEAAPPATPVAAAQAPKSNAALVKEAREAYNRADKAAFLSIYEDLARRRPGEVFTLYNLACGQALNGQSAAAVRTLEEIVAHRVASNLDADTDFESIRQTEGYKRVVTRNERASPGASVLGSGAGLDDFGEGNDRRRRRP